jgi:hypothetical protein
MNNFFKQNSNAKILNNLSYSIDTSSSNETSLITNYKESNHLTSLNHYVCIYNNKGQSPYRNKLILSLDENEINILNNTKNIFYKNYYNDILLIKKAIEYIFSFNDSKYHKYININIKCSNIYTENALKEWIYDWFEVNTKISNKNSSDVESSNRIILEPIYKKELKNIYDTIKKCKVLVN